MAGWGSLAYRGIKSASQKRETSKALEQLIQVIPTCSLTYRVNFSTGQVQEVDPRQDAGFTHFVVTWGQIAGKWPAPGLDKDTKSALIRGFRDRAKEISADLGGRGLILLEISRNGTISPAMADPHGLHILDLRVPAVAAVVSASAPRLFPAAPPPPGFAGAPLPSAPPPPPPPPPPGEAAGPSAAGTSSPDGGSKFCTACGGPNRASDKFCSRCGQPMA